MNWDQTEGKWKQLKGSLKEHWGKLTEDDLTVINGNREKFVLFIGWTFRYEEAQRGPLF
jgi:hypothetical protein